MIAIDEHAEIIGYLRGASGRDLLPSLPIVSAAIQTTPVLYVLREACSQIAPRVRAAVGRRVTVAAFGSLGRREYVPGASDIDPIILVEGSVTADLRTTLRNEILRPLAAMNPWLPFDHPEQVRDGAWDAMAQPDIPYPVIGTDELYAQGRDKLLNQRRWQILLEGRPLMDRRFFHEVYEGLLPHVRRGNHVEIDFDALATDAAFFFGAFDNPRFLHKSAFKFFKTRFLRDFFIFATQLVFIVGHYMQRAQERINVKYVRAATVSKMMRATRLAEQIDQHCATNSGVARAFRTRIGAILAAHALDEAEILRFGNHFRSEPARILHGLLMSVLSRFSDCWDQIYSDRVRASLANIDHETSVESVFPQQGLAPDVARLLADLQEYQRGYQVRMSATAQVIREIFVAGHVWNNAAQPAWLAKGLEVFIRPLTAQ